MSRRSTRRPHRPRTLRTRLLGERGAAAVEFALVAPVLVMLLIGIVECSKMFQAQGTLSSAAREAVRTMALTNNATTARTAAVNAASSLGVPAGSVTFQFSRGSSCSGATATDTVTARITYRQTFVSGLLGRTGVDLTGTARMRCGG
jgi:Flp pilus assembly protein TadG